MAGTGGGARSRRLVQPRMRTRGRRRAARRDPWAGKLRAAAMMGCSALPSFKPVGATPSACAVMCSGRRAQVPFRRLCLSSSDFMLIFGFLFRFYIPPSSNLLGWNAECLHRPPYASDSMLRTKKQCNVNVSPNIQRPDQWLRCWVSTFLLKTLFIWTRVSQWSTMSWD